MSWNKGSVLLMKSTDKSVTLVAYPSKVYGHTITDAWTYDIRVNNKRTATIGAGTDFAKRFCVAESYFAGYCRGLNKPDRYQEFNINLPKD